MKQLMMGASALVLAAGFSAPALADYDLTILHINDLHSRIEPINKYDSGCSEKSAAEGKCFGGIARIKTALDERRAALSGEGKNFVTLDAGDQFQGSLFYTTYKGKAAVEFMNMLDFDAMAVGNHEFDDGPAALEKFIDAADFPVISGNIEVNNEPLLKGKVPGTLILEKGGEKVGIVSALAEDTDVTSSPGAGVRFIMAEDYLKGAVEALEAAGVNKIIALTHAGLTRDKQIAAAVPGIDVIVGGHSHTLLSNTQKRAKGPYPVLVKNPEGKDVPIVQAYAYGKFLGEIAVTWDDNGDVIKAVGEPILLDSSVAEDETMKARVAELAAPIQELKAQVIGSAAEMIDGSRNTCRAGECAMGNLVADAILDATKDQGIEIVIQNGGGLRASIDAGEVTMGEVLTVLPFQNTLATFEMKGSHIKEALENGASKLEEGAGRFAQVAGIKYSFDASKPAGERIVALTMTDGSPIDPDKVYKVATNNYMRGGGDGYKVFAEHGMNAYDYGPGLEIVLADYLKAHKDYQPKLDGRVTAVK
ncbi:bifunctional metallophosphatase/5'-nucleotidase [Polycladidibacter hongkongensis]|uniref:bifunctional metallophosphatase/5'-nucleotidase n=1 Tax=Polycladidibacter hongkongensis TaxID=1647556 RepID=UPI00082F9502|nr:bifunctional metallophosphatase/5'-nucleotidase [Pseudovibrio hongkongensis]